MIFPAHKLFSVIPGVTFDYSFRFNLGRPGSSAPEDLDGYTATWTITWATGSHTYTSGASQGQSGIFFGGTNNDPTTGVIDLIITANDTAALPWTQAAHALDVTSPLPQTYQLIAGSIAVVGYLS